MGIQRTARTIHWDYVLSLEEDLLRLSRFVDFSGNDSTYSIEIARILMAASAEADVVLKATCRAKVPRSRASTLNGYFPHIRDTCPGLLKLEVLLDRYGMRLHPWTDWTDSKAPFWWTANNKVKHERGNRFTEANLKNCLNAVAGVFAAVLYLYREEAESGELMPVPTLLRIPSVMSNAMDAHPARFYYTLP